MGDCCPGWTVDVTVGEASITLHGHALLTPEVLDTMLARLSATASQVDATHMAVAHKLYGSETVTAGDDTTG